MMSSSDTTPYLQLTRGARNVMASVECALATSGNDDRKLWLDPLQLWIYAGQAE